MPLIGLLVIGLGLLNVLVPQKMWRATEAWKYKNPDAVEPSGLSYARQRVTGGVMVIGGLWMMTRFS